MRSGGLCGKVAFRLALTLLIALSLSGGAFAAIGSSIDHRHHSAFVEHCSHTVSDQACDGEPGKGQDTKGCLEMGCAAGVGSAFLPRLTVTGATKYTQPSEKSEELHPSGRAVAPDVPIPLI